MNPKVKSEFVYIKPKSPDSNLVFEMDFKQLHSCKVIRKDADRFYVKSIAGDYYFWVNKIQDPNWELIK
jgi:hypothetical protein